MSEPLRVLVAGAAGALGQHVTRELVDRGHDVRALIRASPLPEGLGRRVEVVTADALESASLGDPCDGRDAVFSCLGASVFPEMARGRRSFCAVDTPANLNLLAASEAAGVRRFVYVSVAGRC
jgi:nucleoside-diphosphate-sugar epimerase